MTTPVVLVSGASSGIGEATALRLLRTGFVVYAGARRTQRMAALADRGAVPVALDVTDDDSMTSLVERIVSERGRIDVLINNAGYGSYGALEDVPMSEARAQLEVNLFGLARLTQLVLPHMRRERRGRIVNVSSMGGRFGEALGSWYHASKFAVEGLSDSLRLELREFGIRVVVIEPGTIRTEWGDIALKQAGRHSAGGPYGWQLEPMRRLYTMAERFGADPAVVADTIAKAATTPRPRPRYAVPFHAKAVVLTARLLPAGVLDTLMRPRRGRAGLADTTPGDVKIG
jgi:NAD(P)-dependent dehydrogenase (short-subunit alcohol dehydrogenase family)